MKTLKDHVIIYDSECPLCDIYTHAFVHTGMLTKSGREAWCDIPQNKYRQLDTTRACNEIALINTKSGQVTYGIESLLTILGYNLPWLRIGFKFPGFQWCFKKLYVFISYNRKVIAPARRFEHAQSCTPTFHIAYRWAYIIFTWIITSLILTEYAKTLSSWVPAGGLLRETAVCGGQILFQGVFISMLYKKRVLHYLGNMMTVSFIGALLLLPGLGSIYLLPINPYWIAPIWFSLVVCWMLWEHSRRVKLLGIHWTASLGWVIYRLLVLAIIMLG